MISKRIKIFVGPKFCSVVIRMSQFVNIQEAHRHFFLLDQKQTEYLLITISESITLATHRGETNNTNKFTKKKSFQVI